MVTEAELYTPADPAHAVARSRRGGGGLYDCDLFALHMSADHFSSLFDAQRWVQSKVGS